MNSSLGLYSSAELPCQLRAQSAIARPRRCCSRCSSKPGESSTREQHELSERSQRSAFQYRNIVQAPLRARRDPTTTSI